MSGLKCSEAEAREVLEYDKEIDKAKPRDKPKAYDLTSEQQEVARQMTRTGTRKTPVYNLKPPKERPKDMVKIELIAELAEFLTSRKIENTITNPTRQISFTLDGETYDLTLIRNNKNKGQRGK